MPKVLLRDKEISIRDDFSGLIKCMLELDPEHVVEITDYPEIFEYLLIFEPIPSLAYALKLITSITFYNVADRYVSHIRSYFWREIAGYNGPKLDINFVMADFLKVQERIDTIIRYSSKFGSISACVALKTEHMRMLYKPPPFIVTELILTDLKPEEHSLVPSMINCFAETLETTNTLAKVAKLPCLIYLDIQKSPNVESLSFCEETLLELNIARTDYGDDFVSGIVRLEKLEAYLCKNITTVKPFARTLLELNAGATSGINDAGLVDATNLTVLSAAENPRITTVAPFGKTLCELDASLTSINNAGLAKATNLEMLSASASKITTVKPFAKTLRKLYATWGSKISDAGLVDATNIEVLYALGNPKITTVKPFAKTLRELGASHECGINDAGLVDATNLVKLVARQNSKITSLEPFAETLQELDASEQFGITDHELAKAVNLMKVSTYGNPNISSKVRYLPL
jgi:Leucine-rich repeat (LRR) protein